jgi:short-subunit dehydrogenase
MSLPIICITGGANGLGREIVASLSNQAQIIIFDIEEKVTKVVAQKFNCDYQICDVSDYNSISSSIKKVIKKYKRIDCFINNAGVYIDGEIESNDPKLIKKVYEVNTIGPVFTTQVLTPFLKKQKSGIIININSTASLHPKAYNSVYHSSKWALKGFSESIQPELANFGIKVIDICPGIMKTKFTDGTNCNLSKAMEPHQVVKVIDFILSLDKDTTISQLTIKHL